MERGDIYMVSLDPSKGREQKGHRPVLIVSPGKFNAVTNLPIVLPITAGGNFARTAGFAVSLSGAGTNITGVIHCDQPRVLDIHARGGKMCERVPDFIIEEVLLRLAPIFGEP
jgi:mRNA-degrading endonuclease toxin of MazEF toxin-antitoxin module